MEYVFRIHDTQDPNATRPTPAANVNGWSNVAHIEGGLLKNIVLGQDAHKAGTSIPSIFARLQVYKGAFNIMSNANAAQLRGVNINTKVISECWDLLEFLFQHGEDNHLIVRRWDVAQQIAYLNQSQSEGHRKLATVLNDERHDIANVNSLYLFYWKDYTSEHTEVETLIGGTSPYTLAYISSNWKRKARKHGWSFSRLDGSTLFDERDIRSLLDRHISFKTMIYALYMAYSNVMSQICPDFTSYINTCWNEDSMNFPEIASKYGNNPQQFLTDFPSLSDEIGGSVGVPINMNTVPISYSKIDVTGSDYMMRPSIGMTPENTPFVLNPSGVAGATYIGSSLWDPTRCLINEAYVRTTPISSRTLPGGQGIKHPFVTVIDFLEDKLIKTPREIDGTKFLTCKGGNSRYLLPLKPKFFEYFTLDDIKNNIVVAVAGGVQKHLVEIIEQNNTVSVSLNIPIKAQQGAGYVELKKSYLITDIVDVLPNPNFSLAVFPFYNVSDNASMNSYSILACGNGITLKFHNIQSNGTIQQVNADKCAQPRNQSQGVFDETNYYNIVGSKFNCIELKTEHIAGSARALIIPLLKEVSSTSAKRFTFAVDFGTSNTHIAYFDSIDTNPRIFTIGADDQQTVFISKEHGPMKPLFEREFAPVLIGANSYASYPSRTAVCESPNFTGSIHSFGNISIGYTIDSEAFPEPGQRFNTDLKWALEVRPGDAVYASRVRAYFKQILWTLKNKVLINGGDGSFEVLLTFPAAMTVATRNVYIGIWNSVKTELAIPNCTITYNQDTSESVAPYYDLVDQVVGSSFLNIDIGGGTSDFLYVIKDGAGHITHSLYSSVMYAADDLWGDGQQTLANYSKDNGFYQYLSRNIEEQAGAFNNDVLAQFRAAEQIMPKSSDLMSFLFKHDTEFNVSNTIKSNQDLYTLIFIHYASIIYYVGKTINRLGIEIPEYISLTGLGSKYVNIISPFEHDVKNFTKLLLENFTGKKCPNTFVIHLPADRKEITARGALKSKLLQVGSLAINDLEQVNEHGFDVPVGLTYQQAKQDDIKDLSMTAHKDFVNTLRQSWFTNYLNNNFNIILNDQLLTDLVNLGENSYTNICACIPLAKDNVTVNESLFFWPLKNALYELSKRYM